MRSLSTAAILLLLFTIAVPAGATMEAMNEKDMRSVHGQALLSDALLSTMQTAVAASSPEALETEEFQKMGSLLKDVELIRADITTEGLTVEQSEDGMTNVHIDRLTLGNVRPAVDGADPLGTVSVEDLDLSFNLTLVN